MHLRVCYATGTALNNLRPVNNNLLLSTARIGTPIVLSGSSEESGQAEEEQASREMFVGTAVQFSTVLLLGIPSQEEPGCAWWIELASSTISGTVFVQILCHSAAGFQAHGEEPAALS